MAYYKATEQDFESVADAIREKTGRSAKLEFPTEFISEIGSISGGGGDLPTISRADWDLLTTEQKKAYDLVGIIDTDSGYVRGEVVYGRDYIDYSRYLPSSDPTSIKCVAVIENFLDGSTTWGAGLTSIIAEKGLSKYQNEDAVYFDALSNSNLIMMPINATPSDFTVYVVAKGLSYANGDVLVLGSVSRWTNSELIMLYHRSGTVWRSSVYGNDYDFIDTQGDYVAVAIRSQYQSVSDYMLASWFGNGVPSRTDVRYYAHSANFGFGGFYDSFHSVNEYNSDLAVKFVGYVDKAETNDQITANLANLASMFGLQ